MNETRRSALEAIVLQNEIRDETQAIFSTIFNGVLIYTIINQDSMMKIGAKMDDIISFCEEKNDRCLYRK